MRSDGIEKPTAWAWPPKRVKRASGASISGCAVNCGEGVEEVKAVDGAA